MSKLLTGTVYIYIFKDLKTTDGTVLVLNVESVVFQSVYWMDPFMDSSEEPAAQEEKSIFMTDDGQTSETSAKFNKVAI